MNKFILFSVMVFAGAFAMAQTSTTDEGVVIDGVKWATRNVDKPGTFAARPESPGMLYQWGSNVGWTYHDPLLSSDGETDWKFYGSDADIWENSNNVCPEGWRIPKPGELTMLVNSGSKWTYGGRTFGNDENNIFLPAVGLRNSASSALFRSGSFGYYWSNATRDKYALHLYFGESIITPADSGQRTSGFSVRCVAK